MKRNVKEYDVFKLAHRAVIQVYKITKKFPSDEKFGLVSQLRRASYSIPMNLVEGGARESQKEFHRFVNIAQGSCEEVRYQLELARDLEYITENEFDDLSETFTRIIKMLNKLSSTLKTPRSKYY